VSLLVSAQLVVTGVCLALGLQHGFVWLRRRGNTAYLLIAIAALAAGANALVEVGMYTASSVEQYGAEIRWSVAFIDLFLGALIWFVVAWTGTARRWLAVVATCVLGIVLAGMVDSQLHDYLACGGEFDGIPDQVDQNLAQPAGVADDEGRHTGVYVADELQALFVGQHCEEFRCVLCNGSGIEFDLLDLDLSRLDFREIQDLIDDPEEGLG